MLAIRAMPNPWCKKDCPKYMPRLKWITSQYTKAHPVIGDVKLTCEHEEICKMFVNDEIKIGDEQ